MQSLLFERQMESRSQGLELMRGKENESWSAHAKITRKMMKRRLQRKKETMPTTRCV